MNHDITNVGVTPHFKSIKKILRKYNIAKNYFLIKVNIDLSN